MDGASGRSKGAKELGSRGENGVQDVLNAVNDLNETNKSREEAESVMGARQYQKIPKEVDRRIYCLGIGSIGKLIAFSLATLPDPPPVTLILRKRANQELFDAQGRKITVVTEGVEEVASNFDSETSVHPARTPRYNPGELEDGNGEETPSSSGFPPHTASDQSDAPISNLIVMVKASSTVSSLLGLRHRLGPFSTICFLQNGMGIVDEVNEKVFPDPLYRPAYMFGVVSHGVNSPSRFTVERAGIGSILVALQPRTDEQIQHLKHMIRDHDTSSNTSPSPLAAPWAASGRYILRSLSRSPGLCCVGVSPPDLLVAQLEKLAVNCVVNPLTAILNCRNGALLNTKSIHRIMRLLIAEISLVFSTLPELKSLPNASTRFSPARLETICTSVAKKTGGNISSMLADVRQGNITEVEWLNGYIVKRGEELGIHCALNYMILCLVHAKGITLKREVGQRPVPLVEDDTHDASQQAAVGTRRRPSPPGFAERGFEEAQKGDDRSFPDAFDVLQQGFASPDAGVEKEEQRKGS